MLGAGDDGTDAADGQQQKEGRQGEEWFGTDRWPLPIMCVWQRESRVSRPESARGVLARALQGRETERTS